MNVINLDMVDLSALSQPAEMTDDQWQQYFNNMKSLVSPSNEKRLKVGKSFTLGYRRLESQSTYSGDTQWQRYCQFINGILKAIRNGEEDYCFYIYQVADLLRFEHDRLCAQWQPEDKCFRIWLK